MPSPFKVHFTPIRCLVFAPLLLSLILVVCSAVVSHLCVVSVDVKVASGGPWGGGARLWPTWFPAAVHGLPCLLH